MIGETMEARIARFGRRLAGPMADEAWGLDLAQRLLAYDPKAESISSVEFEPDDRIVVLYRCEGKSQLRRSFVVAKWTPPMAVAAA